MSIIIFTSFRRNTSKYFLEIRAKFSFALRNSRAKWNNCHNYSGEDTHGNPTFLWADGGHIYSMPAHATNKCGHHCHQRILHCQSSISSWYSSKSLWGNMVLTSLLSRYLPIKGMDRKNSKAKAPHTHQKINSASETIFIASSCLHWYFNVIMLVQQNERKL